MTTDELLDDAKKKIESAQRDLWDGAPSRRAEAYASVSDAMQVLEAARERLREELT
jgi:hypothetical protein